VYGLSLGGYNAALLAAVESELAGVIAGIPAADFVSKNVIPTCNSVRAAGRIS
jgi:hypothetical protein